MSNPIVEVKALETLIESRWFFNELALAYYGHLLGRDGLLVKLHEKAEERAKEYRKEKGYGWLADPSILDFSKFVHEDGTYLEESKKKTSD